RTDFAAAAYHWDRVRALRRHLPDDRDVAALGIAACTQLLTSSWRIGSIGLDEARELLEEGRVLADMRGDPLARLHLSLVYGRALLSAGEVADSVALAVENQRVASELAEVATEAHAYAALIDALGHTARPREALSLAEEALARFPCHLPREAWIFGRNPHLT